MSRADEFFGAGSASASAGVDRMFPSGSVAAGVPWAQAGRSKSRPVVGDRDVIGKELMQPPPAQLREFDPRTLTASQGMLTRDAVAHYMTDDYARTGRPYRDQHEIGNQTPLVYRRPARTGGHEDVIMSGHHRAAAALLQGRQFPARFVEGP